MDMWTIGVADRLRFPRLPSQLGRRGNARLRPHPTGTATNHGFDLDDVNGRFAKPAVASTAIGVDINTGRLHLNNRLRLSHGRGPPKTSRRA